MQIYDKLLPEEYQETILYRGKYATETADGNSYRFTYPPYRFAVDVENYLLGAGFRNQCDVMYFTKRLENTTTVYKSFLDRNLSTLIYFINEDYTGGAIRHNGEVIQPKANKAVYFESDEDIELDLVEKGEQYLLISYFRQNPIKGNKSII